MRVILDTNVIVAAMRSTAGASHARAKRADERVFEGALKAIPDNPVEEWDRMP